MRRRVLQISSLVCLVSALAGCGQQSKQYATSKAANTFFTVPNGWNEISYKKLTAYEKSRSDGTENPKEDSVIWQVAYTPLKNVKLSQVYSIQPFAKPLVVVRVRNLTYQEANAISYNGLREIVIPFQTWVENPDQAPPGFKVISDYEISDQGVRGIRSIFKFDSDNVSQTFDQVSMVSDDRTTLYFLLSRCTTTCYVKNQKVIDEIVKSFSVRGKK